MTTPILPMIPKIIVALGESAHVVGIGTSIGVELGSVNSGVRNKSSLLTESNIF